MTTLIPKFEQQGSTVNRPINLKLQETISVTDFGANPSNTAAQNDIAFHAASNAIVANGGGILLIPPGIYTVCQQHQNYNPTFGPDAGNGPYAWYAEPPIWITGCPNGVKIEAYGAKLVMPNGQYFGSFVPGTTTPYTPPSLPFYNNAYGAMPGYFVAIYNNTGPISIVGLECNGNNVNYVVGGQWGDTGYQVAADGFYIINNLQTSIKDCIINNCGRDGIDYIYYNLGFQSSPTPALIENVIANYNTRNNLSIQGGIGINISNSDLSYSGQAINVGTGTNLYSSPGACVDIEPVTGTIASNIEFNNVNMIGSYGTGFGCDNGISNNITVNDCTIWSPRNASIAINNPYVVFNNTKIYGAFTEVYSSYYSVLGTIGGNGTKFYGCLFSDPLLNGQISGQGTSSPGIVGIGSAKGVSFVNCSFVNYYQPLGTINDAYIENCNFVSNCNTLPDKTAVLDISGSTFVNNQIYDNVTTTTANGYYVKLNFSQAFIGNNYLHPATINNDLKWVNWDSNAGGFTGYYGSKAADWTSLQFLGINKNLNINNYSGYIRVFANTAAPTTGTYYAGDRCYNQAPAVGQPKGWICTVSGTPGTWVSEGNL